ncbi:prepilin-type N-terminal cleavage/methylation domain-containing protein [Curtobacterium sp. MCLR17_032]|uniref:PulJ/GspJ family protein n=1 Tax=Curtobacterium sp. MCLR17_032 TaxID=2175650 RepID=UPI000DA87B45|nr:prepilin-type N-terminal cleavage/methylation domain-containing protein [Curtobacterium sp. MCLR17_032]WIE61243.1 prepilin-type N-terminal cleavage/methylation domain-containing protein [Curtobacterium sp. MCLR17_032]
MRAVLALIDRVRRDERGISLVELIVAMTLSVIVLAVAGAFLVSSQNASVTAQAVNMNTRSASAAMNEMTRIMRSATNNPVATGDDSQYAFQYASATNVRFFSYVNTTSTVTQPVQVQLGLDPARGTITETKWTGTAVQYTDYFAFPLSTQATLTAAPASTRTLANGVVSASVFQFSDASGAVLGSPTVPLSATDLAKVRRVSISVTTGTSPTDPRATTLQNSVSLANL